MRTSFKSVWLLTVGVSMCVQFLQCTQSDLTAWELRTATVTHFYTSFCTLHWVACGWWIVCLRGAVHLRMLLPTTKLRRRTRGGWACECSRVCADMFGRYTRPNISSRMSCIKRPGGGVAEFSHQLELQVFGLRLSEVFNSPTTVRANRSHSINKKSRNNIADISTDIFICLVRWNNCDIS